MMSRMKKCLAAVLAVVLCLSCTACGSTVGSNTKIYFDQVSLVLNNLFAKQDTTRGTTPGQSSATGTPLAAPANFSVDANGNYSFSSVEGAEYYLIYFCAPDATSDSDSFLYSSSPISGTGNRSYSGQCSDLFDYAYGEYLVKVFAFPDLTSAEYSMSASAGYTFSGPQSAPVISYYWNTFDGTMGVQLNNMDEYLYQAYPDRVDVTFTNTQDSADVVTITIADIAPDHNAAESSQLRRGASYDVTAVATSSSAYVTNAVSDTTQVASALLLGESHQFTPGYSYSDGFSDNNFKWPVLVEVFDLANGGTGGSAPYRVGQLTLDLTPAETTPGSAYSYTIAIDIRWPIGGTAEFYPDGTFKMEEAGGGPVSTSSIEGTWIDNGDGTATLNYDHSTVIIQ